MPTYDYECARCGTMEIVQSMKASTLTNCPECGSKRFRKLVSMGAGLIFKGDGFWETDYNRSPEYQKAASADSAPASGDKPSDSPSTQTAASGDSSTAPAAAAGGPAASKAPAPASPSTSSAAPVAASTSSRAGGSSKSKPG